MAAAYHSVQLAAATIPSQRQQQQRSAAAQFLSNDGHDGCQKPSKISPIALWMQQKPLQQQQQQQQ
jgi:hypothetical protein